MHKIETKIITKKLRSGNFQFFLNTYKQMLSEGWEDCTRPLNDGYAYRVTMQKEVNIDSTEPDKSETNCRPAVVQHAPQDIKIFYEDEDGQIVDITDCKIEVNEGDGETVPLVGLVKEYIAEGGQEQQETLVNMTSEIELSPETDVEHSDPIPEMFDKRPYTAEELKDWGWTELTKLGGILGAGIGSRDKREANIVALSLAQWGTPNE